MTEISAKRSPRPPAADGGLGMEDDGKEPE